MMAISPATVGTTDRAVADMRAAVYHGPHDIRIEQIPLPVPREGELLVRVLRSGLCGTDVTEWTSGPIMIPIDHEHPHSHHHGPMVTGHEFVGTVVQAPADCSFAPGDLVVCGASVPCWNCRRCREGRTNICENLYSLGLNAPGGHAEFVVGPPGSFVGVPDGLDLDSAALAQPLAVGIHAARRSGTMPGDVVLIIGAGAIGTFTLIGMRHLVPDAHILVADIDDARRARALRLGADETIDLRIAEPANRPDVVLEASGAPGQLAGAIRLVRPGGRVLAVGMPAKPAELEIHRLVLNEITLDSTVALVLAEDLLEALSVLAERDLAAEMLDSVRPLGTIVETLDELATGQVQGKVLLDPTR